MTTADPRISFTMIVRNVADFIVPCLESVAPAIDEAVIVDTGSADRTKEVVHETLRRLNVRFGILDFNPTTNPEAFLLDDRGLHDRLDIPGAPSGIMMLADYGAARRAGWSKCTGEYVLWIDSDDLLVGAENIRGIAQQLKQSNLVAAFLDYEYMYDADGNPVSVLQRERLAHRSAVWGNPIHEALTAPNWSWRHFDGVKVKHRRQFLKQGPMPAHRNVKILLHHQAQELAAGRQVDPRILFYIGQETKDWDVKRARAALNEYVTRSGWTEERARAYCWLGNIAENVEASKPKDTPRDYEEAFRAYAASVAEFPACPDGHFGLMRVYSYRQRWSEAADHGMRGRALVKQGSAEVMPFDPQQRLRDPPTHLSYVLAQAGRTADAIEVTREGLQVHTDPNSQEHKNLKYNLDNLTGTAAATSFNIRDDEPLDSPPLNLPAPVVAAMATALLRAAKIEGKHIILRAVLPPEATGTAIEMTEDVPHGVLVANAVQIWKRIASPAQARVFIDSLPSAVASSPQMQEARRRQTHSITAPLEGKKRIAIWTGNAWEPWSPASINDGGIGGSETAAVHLARELVKLGHKVVVYGEWSGVDDGVEYVHHTSTSLNEPVDLLIASRQPWAIDRVQAARKVLWVHDIHAGMEAERKAELRRFNRIVALSEWHKGFLQQTYPDLPADKIVVRRNALDPMRFKGPMPTKRNRAIYGSSPDRGLERLLYLWPSIRAFVPDAELHIYYGFNTWEKMGHNRDEITRLRGLVERTEGVVYHGRVGQGQLAEAYLEAKVWSYPTWFHETSCISAMEAQAAGCVPVTTNLAALAETVHSGILLPPPCTDEAYGIRFVQHVVQLFKDEAVRREIADRGRTIELARGGWAAAAKEWATELVEASNEIPAPKIEVGERPLRLAMIYGAFSTGMHGGFDIPALKDRGLTGSESCYFNMVRGMAERGHQVDAFCVTGQAYHAAAELAGAHVYPLDTPRGDYDAHVVWNEPDYLAAVPSGLRICFQQLNDFASYCRPGFDKYVDLYLMPSLTHLEYLLACEEITKSKTAVLPNSINLENFQHAVRRFRHAVVWCSSPDRGLHVMLPIFEEVRKRVPDAILKVFYRYDKWVADQQRFPQSELAGRARQIEAHLARVGRSGENGVVMFDSVPNIRVAKELLSARAFAYTCEPIRFTEGFSVATMDACAAGCVPVISNADALQEVYAGAAQFVAGKPSTTQALWVDLLSQVLTNDAQAEADSQRAQLFAAKFDRRLIAERFENIVRNKLGGIA